MLPLRLANSYGLFKDPRHVVVMNGAPKDPRARLAELWQLISPILDQARGEADIAESCHLVTDEEHNANLATINAAGSIQTRLLLVASSAERQEALDRIAEGRRDRLRTDPKRALTEEEEVVHSIEDKIRHSQDRRWGTDLSDDLASFAADSVTTAEGRLAELIAVRDRCEALNRRHNEE